MKFPKIVASIIIVLQAGELAAQILAPTTITQQAPQTRWGLTLGFAEIDYDFEGFGNNEDLERSLVGVHVSHAISQRIRLLGQFAYNYDVELGSADGQGFMIGAGFQGMVYHRDQHRLFGVFLLNRTADNLEANGVDGDLTVMDLHFGVGYAFPIDPDLAVYTGLEIVSSNGDYDVGDASIDAERDDPLIWKVGVMFALAEFVMRPEFVLLGEELSIYLALDFDL